MRIWPYILLLVSLVVVAEEVWMQSVPPFVIWPPNDVPSDNRDIRIFYNSGSLLYMATNWGGAFVTNGQTFESTIRTFGDNRIPGATDSWYSVQYSYGLCRSTNAGIYWQSLGSGGTNWLNVACGGAKGEVVLSMPYAGYAVLSTNWGQSWSAITAAPAAQWRGAFVSTNGAVLALCGANQQVWMSWNTGQSWAAKTPPQSSPSAIVCSQDGTNIFLAVTFKSCYRSGDAGASWTQINAIPPYQNNELGLRCSTDFKHIYLIQVNTEYTNTMLWHSHDAGTNWSSAVYPSNKYNTALYASTDGKYLVFVGQVSGTNVLLGSKDYGSTIELIDPTSKTRFGVFVWVGILK